MLRQLFKKLNRKAFTLIEILLAIGLLAIVSVGIGAVIMSTQNNTEKMLNEAELQQQLVEVQETFYNEILSANGGIKYWTKQTKHDDWEMVDADEGDEYQKLIAFYNINVSDFVLTKTYYLFDSSRDVVEMAVLEEQLDKDQENAQEWNGDQNIAQVLETINKKEWTTVATKVDQLTFDLSGYNTNKLISYTANIKQGNTEYPTDDTVYIRNDISVNKPIHVDEYHVVLVPKPTLADTYFVYDGEEHGPTEIQFLDRFVQHASGTTLTAVNAGTYEVKYSLIDKNASRWEDGTTNDITYTWSIEPKEIILNWGETEWLYDGSTHSTTCTASGLVPGDTCEIELSGNSVGPNVGTAVCTAKTKNENYKVPAVNAVTLKILPSNAEAEIKLVERTYNGSPQSMVELIMLSNGTIKYYISTDANTPDESQVNNSTCTATNAGIYYVWYIVEAENDNYTGIPLTYAGSVEMKRLPTAKVDKQDKTYNGSPQVGVFGEHIILTGQHTETNAGTYTAYAEPDSNHLWEDGTDSLKTLVWTMHKAENTLELSATSGTITYPSKGEVSVTKNTSGGALSVTPGNAGVATATVANNKVTITPGTGLGTTTITVTSAETDNYLSKSVTYEITVNPGTLTVTASGYSGIYDGKAHGISVSSTPTATVSYSTSKNGTYNTQNITHTNAGKYTVYYKVSKPGYTDVYGDETVEIKKAAGQVVLSSTSGSLTYPNTGSFTVTTNKSGGDLSITNSNSSSATASLSGTKISLTTKNSPGTVKITVTSAATDNYESASATYTLTVIGKLTVTANGYSGTYDGNAHGISVTSSPSATITYSTSQNGTYRATNYTYANAGTYTVWYKVTKDGYETVTGSKQVVIKKAAGQVVLSSTSGSLTYPNTGSFTVTTNKSGGDLSITNSNSSSATASLSGTKISLTTKNSPGTVKITVTSAATDNYESASATYTLTVIGKLTVTANGYSGTYDGNAHGISVTSSPTATITYSTNGSTYSSTNPTWTNYTGGAQTVYYKVEKTGYETVTGSKTVTINKAAGYVSPAPTAKSLTYNKSSQTLINAGYGTGEMYYSVNGGSYSKSLPTGLNAGTYTVRYYAAESTNYTQSPTGQLDVTIGQANGWVTLSASNGSTEYGYNTSFTIKETHGGDITIGSSNTSVATVSRNGTTVTVVPKAKGTAVITVTSAATTNYKSASATYIIEVKKTPTVFLYQNGLLEFRPDSIPSYSSETARWSTADKPAIIGTGYSSHNSVPWYGYRTSVTSVKIVSGFSTKNPSYWFYGMTNCKSFDVSGLNTTGATTMTHVFYEAASASTISSPTITGLENWNTASVTDMQYMFANYARSATGNITIGGMSGWNTAKVTNMSYMFQNVGYKGGTTMRSLTIDGVSSWNTAAVIDMSYMFNGTGWAYTNVSGVDLSTWNVSNVRYMQWMIGDFATDANAWSVGNIGGWNTGNVTNMEGLFRRAGQYSNSMYTGDISNWNTAKVTNMKEMFWQAAQENVQFSGGTLGGWNVSNVTTMEKMFYQFQGQFGDNNGDGIPESKRNTNALSLNLAKWNTKNVKSMSYMLAWMGPAASTWYIGDISGWNTSSCTDMTNMFWNSGNQATNWSLNLTNWDVDQVTSYANFDIGVDTKIQAPSKFE